MAWLTNWTYRKPITVTNENADYQTKVLVGESSGAAGEEVDCGGHVAADFDDLRFTAADGTTLLDYWIESITGTTPNGLATVWVQNNAGADATLYMYYGGTETAVSNAANTFIQYHGAATEASFHDADVTGVGADLYFRAKVKSNDGIADWGIGNQYDRSDDAIFITTHDQAGNNRYLQCYDEGVQTVISETPDFSENTTVIIEIKILSGVSVYGYVDGDPISTSATTGIPTETMGLIYYAIQTTSWQDWSFIAKYAAAEQTFAFGSEETETAAFIPRVTGII